MNIWYGGNFFFINDFDFDFENELKPNQVINIDHHYEETSALKILAVCSLRRKKTCNGQPQIKLCCFLEYNQRFTVKGHFFSVLVLFKSDTTETCKCMIVIIVHKLTSLTSTLLDTCSSFRLWHDTDSQKLRRITNFTPGCPWDNPLYFRNWDTGWWNYNLTYWQKKKRCFWENSLFNYFLYDKNYIKYSFNYT